MLETDYEKMRRKRGRNRAISMVVTVVVLGIVGLVLYGVYSVPPQDRALIAAVKNGDADGVRQAIGNGADVNLPDRSGQTPLHIAAWRGDTASARLLLLAGADIEARDRKAGETPLHTAARGDHPDMITLLLGRGANTRARTLREGEPCASGIRHPANATAREIAQASGHAEVERRLSGN